jgi:hypothetical protein
MKIYNFNNWDSGRINKSILIDALQIIQLIVKSSHLLNQFVSYKVLILHYSCKKYNIKHRLTENSRH